MASSTKQYKKVLNTSTIDNHIDSSEANLSIIVNDENLQYNIDLRIF